MKSKMVRLPRESLRFGNCSKVLLQVDVPLAVCCSGLQKVSGILLISLGSPRPSSGSVVHLRDSEL